ncbi:hypothetical protein K458DRAFT_86483 [Lentithecium fluviatile CBS 122367]|uniref:Uncharacterized protein n=1 Tax=Lentithecium fluviatile CBS 122367 TaxID=1168545 RepID=A0A6G1ISN9_9PLEO|nr:hypothetical protein K458DRAFT_86483 [Lentithecium fluviatile CBS 122367]
MHPSHDFGGQYHGHYFVGCTTDCAIMMIWAATQALWSASPGLIGWRHQGQTVFIGLLSPLCDFFPRFHVATIAESTAFHFLASILFAILEVQHLQPNHSRSGSLRESRLATRTRFELLDASSDIALAP